MAITSWNVLTAVMSTAELLKMVKSPKSVGIHDTALIRRMQSGRAVSGNIASFKLKQRQPRNLYDSGGSKSTTYSDEPGWQQDDYPGKPLYKSWKRVMSPISNIASMPMVWVTSTPSSTATTPVFFTNTGTATTTTGGIYNNAVVGGGIVNNVPVAVPYIPDHIKLDVGKERTISFPDGTNIYFKVDGSFEIEDKYSRVVYKACRVHDFNPFLNASDKLEDFIKYCGKVGVRSGDMLGIPLRSFVQWLVIEAARADGEEAPVEQQVLMIEELRPDGQPRCLTCQRFMSPRAKEKKIEFCRVSCFQQRLESV